jgi:uncharacterized protein YbjT (DUF2867 family)
MKPLLLKLSPASVQTICHFFGKGQKMAGYITKENILLFGATGYIGEFILDHILEAKDSFGRIAIFTSPGTAEAKAKRLGGLSAKGVQGIVGDVRNTRDILDAYQGLYRDI